MKKVLIVALMMVAGHALGCDVEDEIIMPLSDEDSGLVVGALTVLVIGLILFIRSTLKM